ncbi:ribonuclease domain-containing protein [uncultured Phascolarctobacterium sp.]|uniref:ribonuclease domain-containing protein n=1 Tax=uncultured Phascolarctobacterium sp. TaxID=512296 RepID=UPI0026229CDD|nr:ribonuclease domain-containing protein [uncultured Phascolarctobacterium sp.]
MKKILAFILSLLLCLSLITGCGASKKISNDGNTKVSASIGENGSKKQPAEQQTINKQNTKVANSDANVKANSGKLKISEGAAYTDKEHVAAYINQFAKLPHNYITKNQAKKLGWQTKGTLDKVAPGKSIGGDRYGNYEGKLPKKSGRTWQECDIDYVRGNRNAKRIVYSNDGLIYYTSDHYKNFTKLY